MNSCPNCGGHVLFDIASQQCKCEHCNSFFDPASYQQEGAESRTQYQATVYTCSKCGAELISMEQEAVAFCSYCGAQGVLEGRLSKENRPAWIVPFHVSREDCKKAYADRIRKAWYAPKEFRDPAYIERFRGIYVPYWLYSVDFVPQITLPATKTYTKGSYSYHESHNVTVGLDGIYRGVPYDASSFFDDTIAENIAPYHQSSIVPFQSGYLPGFYADTADVVSETYLNDAATRATNNVMREIVDMYKGKKMTIKEPSSAEAKSLLQTHCTKAESTLFPVWFLTWRKKDRVAYVVMNGETGKMAADLPVDKWRFMLGSLAAAAAIFVIMSLFVSMSAPTALFLASVLATMALGLFLQEVTAIHDRENHIFDRGFFIRGESSNITAEKAEQIREVRLRKKKQRSKRAEGATKVSFSLITTLIVLFASIGMPALAFLIAIFGFIFETMPSSRAIPGCFLTALIGSICFVRLFPLLPRLKKNTLFQALPAFVSVIAAFLIAVARPVSDLYYYYGTILCLAGVVVTCFALIAKYNLMATRAVPEFHDRGGSELNSGRTDIRNRTGRTLSFGRARNSAKFTSFTKHWRHSNTGRTRPRMHGLPSHFLAWLLPVLLVGAAGSSLVFADGNPVYTNAGSGFEVFLDDGEDLLSDAEEAKLVEDMIPISEFGGVAFVSVRNYEMSTSAYAKQVYKEFFGSNSGTVFLIDMGKRNIWIHSNGAIYRTITKGLATSITDNVYTYASDGDYYSCAAEAFRQELQLLEGGRIARPMKHITNALISLILGLMLNFLLLRRTRRIEKTDDSEVFRSIVTGMTVVAVASSMLSRKRYAVVSSDGGSSGGGGGFSGGGGGGFSGGGGGGGGHSF